MPDDPVPPVQLPPQPPPDPGPLAESDDLDDLLDEDGSIR